MARLVTTTPSSKPRRASRRLLWLTLAVSMTLVLIAVAAFGVWFRGQLRASLPQLDGSRALPGLSAPVEVTRDALGIPTVRGRTRHDVSRATGFLHAQERFFQMDLARRRAAGELSVLVGARALKVDKEIRIHRFRDEARRAVSLLKPDDRAGLDAYTEGVNAGLRALGAKPFEYIVLRQAPEPWLPEDTFLVVLSMFITLQDTDGAYEATLATMHEVLPPAMFNFLAPRGTEWDAPVEGPSFAVAAVPGFEAYNLRARRKGKKAIELPARDPDVVRGLTSPASSQGLSDIVFGSNNFVVSGAHTSDGRPRVANDMHLVVRVPNTWYRALLEWSEPAVHRLVGVTLPGTPALVVGSNGDVAWGFTNTYADWSDIVLLDVDPADPSRYRTPGGWQSFERHDEVIRVAGGIDEHMVATWTIWGPVMTPDYRGRPRAYRWVAHDAERLAGTLAGFERARTVVEAFDAANGLGAPGQNLVAADRNGHIGWSIYGAIPRRVGLDGRLPTSWSDGTRSWKGWLDTSRYPRIVDPPSGRIWSANARVVGGEKSAPLGDGNFEVGTRATIIRNRLMAKERFTTDELLDIQLDTSAVFLARWRELILRTLTPGPLAGHSERALFRWIVEKEWTGRATPDSVAYRLTRTFREAVATRVIGFVLSECYEADPSFDYYTVHRREGAIWKLVSEQPHHLLDPQYSTWGELLLSAVDEVIEGAEGRDLRKLTWSDYNVTTYRHPLSPGLPFAGRWLDMPASSLPGDLFTPNMHWGSAAASERMIVSPGREEEGVMQMPTGQSGHPLSPFYANSHDAWVNGERTPLLPGAAQHRLELTPSSKARP
jgi:penicillin amidase